MRKKLQASFQLSIVVLFGFCATTVLAPFAIYRFASGAMLAGILDVSVIVSIASLVLYALKSNRVELAGRVIVVVNCIGVTFSAVLLGFTGVFWVYVVILSNYFLSQSQRFASVSSLLAVAAVLLFVKTFTSPIQMWSFLMTSLLLALLSAIVAYQYDKQNRRLEHLATIDPLTGAYNRRAMETELQRAIESYARKGTQMALIMMDLDNFKLINDQFGHDKGDQLLASFAALVKQNTRKNDRLFRYGGEEFLILVNSGNIEEALALAEKIRQTVEICSSTTMEHITVSLGVASIQDGESLEQWVSRADAAMYRAKQFGKNRVES
ncbi:MAG: diguanylate cyclase [Arenimonas sp.]|nr:diguanylate cyclase [Arenimonas sp.]